MRVKEIEINKINLLQLIDIHLKVNMQEIQWTVKFLLLKDMDYLVVTEFHLQWVHLINMEDMVKDHLKEWWEVLQILEIIFMAVMHLEE